jgi:glutaredoxin-related protein
MRYVLDESKIHPAIRQTISDYRRDIVDEVQAAMGKTDIVVAGMAQNPNCGRACKALKKKGVSFTYIERGSYLSEWRTRLALKMWTGWPTFPMVFVKGTFVGGADDLQKLIDSGELDTLLKG